MDDRTNNLNSKPDGSSSRQVWAISRRSCGMRLGLICVALTICTVLSGCSLFVMAGKSIFGDPVIDCALKQLTSVNLAKGDHKVLVVATAPESVKRDSPGIELDIADRIGRRLRANGVRLERTGKLLTWLDDRGGVWQDVDELALEFDVDYIIHLDFDQLTFHEDNSPNLLRGRVAGNSYVYEVKEEDGIRDAVRIFSQEVTTTYPTHRPKFSHQVSDRIFREEFIDRTCRELAFLFTDHYPFETLY
ncbi:hypothetical protein [Calycomorphotria hydatis]|nr:hypothetical protein [Calycomorphotria hydatis]